MATYFERIARAETIGDLRRIAWEAEGDHALTGAEYARLKRAESAKAWEITAAENKALRAIFNP